MCGPRHDDFSDESLEHLIPRPPRRPFWKWITNMVFGDQDVSIRSTPSPVHVSTASVTRSTPIPIPPPPPPTSTDYHRPILSVPSYNQYSDPASSPIMTNSMNTRCDELLRDSIIQQFMTGDRPFRLCHSNTSETRHPANPDLHD